MVRPKRDVMVYRGGPLYKFEKAEKTKLGNGQKWVKISTYFVKMSFRYKCALTSHFVIFCEFEFSVRSNQCIQT